MTHRGHFRFEGRAAVTTARAQSTGEIIGQPWSEVVLTDGLTYLPKPVGKSFHGQLIVVNDEGIVG